MYHCVLSGYAILSLEYSLLFMGCGARCHLTDREARRAAHITSNPFESCGFQNGKTMKKMKRRKSAHDDQDSKIRYERRYSTAVVLPVMNVERGPSLSLSYVFSTANN